MQGSLSALSVFLGTFEVEPLSRSLLIGKYNYHVFLFIHITKTTTQYLSI